MQYANIMLALGGDSGNQVAKFFVTPAEVLILQAIHGNDAVTEVDILDFSDDRLVKNVSEDDLDAYESRTANEDLARLREEYRHARVDDGNGSQQLVVSGLFPGAGAKAPESFTDLDTLPDEFYKAEERKVPRKAAAKAASKKSTTSKKADAKDAEDDKTETEEKTVFE